MDGWGADWGMWKWWILEWLCEDRLTCRVKDERSSTTGCWLKSAHTGAQKKINKTSTIPLVCIQTLLNLKVYFYTRVAVCVVSRTTRQLDLNGLGQSTIWFMCFLSPWQVNKAGANANKETKRCYQIFRGAGGNIFVNTSLQHDPLIITAKTISLVFLTKRQTGFSTNIIIN